MRKCIEVTAINSCLNKARPDEMVFVLLGRDSSSSVAIRAWVEDRIRNGKNHTGDEQITDALECAKVMELECR